MANSVTMKRNDRRPFLDVILQDVDGAALDLTASVSGVSFTMKNLDTDTTAISASPATIIPQTAGMVRYSWAEGDTAEAGTYVGEFQVMYNDGTKLTIPTSTVLSVVILEDYDNA